MNRLEQEATHAFEERFGGQPSAYVRAPGCVSLLGDQTVFFGGHSLSMAVNMNCVLAFRPNNTNTVNVHSVYLNRTDSISLDEPECEDEIQWTDYVGGAAALLHQEWGIECSGFDGIVAGNLPVEAGLASSSALTVASALAFLHAAGVEKTPTEIAQLCHKVESDHIGVHSEIVSPATCLLGHAGMAIKLDCRNLEVEHVPLLETDATVVVCDSRIRGDNALSEILSRRDQCREGVRMISKFVRGREIRTVGDLTLRDFNLYGPMLQPPTRERVKHIVSENQRVDECAESLLDRNIVRAGVLLDASHSSLRDEYDVSCKELDLLVDIAWNTRMVLGARMSGQGFGGVTVNLVERDGVATLCNNITKQYRARTDITPNVYICQPEKGAELTTWDELK